MRTTSTLAGLCIAALPACTVLHVDNAESAPQVRGHGLIDGYLGFGMPEVGDPLEIQALNNGLSVGVNIFNMFRVEVGGLGFALGVGPVQLGLGTLFYEPDPLPYPRDDSKRERHEHSEHEYAGPDDD